jgi:hypothetical protein
MRCPGRRFWLSGDNGALKTLPGFQATTSGVEKLTRSQLNETGSASGYAAHP